MSEAEQLFSAMIDVVAGVKNTLEAHLQDLEENPTLPGSVRVNAGRRLQELNTEMERLEKELGLTGG